MSGGVDIRPFPKNWEIAKRLGTIEQYPQNWEKNTVINLVDLLKGGNLKIIFDCGVDDFFHIVIKIFIRNCWKIRSLMIIQSVLVNIPGNYLEKFNTVSGFILQ